MMNSSHFLVSHSAVKSLPAFLEIDNRCKELVLWLREVCLKTEGVPVLFPLAVLESWLDYTGELEPPEPLARLPQLKHCIKQLITDLSKVQQIALCCST